MSITAPLLSYANVTSPATPEAAAVSHVPELPLESRAKRYGFATLALLLTVAYACCVFTYWIDLNAGVDQNGYLVGGKMFAETLSMKQAPTKIGQPDQFDPHAFIGNMWVSATSNKQHFYPKYPLGLPLVYAVCLWIGGASWGPTLVHAVSPATMTLAVLGVFYLVRQFAGSFAGALAMLVFATSPLTSALVNNPNSHASTVFCVVWGMLCVLHWWRVGGRRWALLGGILVGYAATIRYSEGALLLPLMWAALMGLLPRWRCWRGWVESSLLLVGWAIPVALLLTYNLIEMGAITGYDTTNESTGFALAFFFDNWETIIRQLSLNGLFLIFPIAIAGLIAMCWWNWRIAVFMWLWVGPCLTIYACYYWAPDGVGYLRFVLTILPPMLVGGFWVLAHVRDLLPQEPPRLPMYLMVMAMTLVALLAGAAAFYGPRTEVHVHWLALTEALTAHPVPVPDANRSFRIEATVQPVSEYVDAQSPISYGRLALRSAFYSSIAMCAAWGAALGTAAFLRRAVVPTLATAVVGFLSIAVQANNSVSQLERESYDKRLIAANVEMIERLVPDKSVLIFREENYLHHLQLVRDYSTYTGTTFDKGWVMGRRGGTPTDPDPMDPARGEQLKRALEPYDQNGLNLQAREMVKNALAANRRVFVVEQARLDELMKARKEHKEGPVPEFLRRFIFPGKDKHLSASRVAYWNVPMPVKDEPKPGARGRRDARPAWRDTCHQLWEITLADG